MLTAVVSNYHHLTRKEMAAEIGKDVRTAGRAIEKLGETAVYNASVLQKQGIGSCCDGRGIMNNELGIMNC